MTKTLKMFLLIYSPFTLFHIVPTFNDLENRNVLKMLWEKNEQMLVILVWTSIQILDRTKRFGMTAKKKKKI